jgi:hypothetical protein
LEILGVALTSAQVDYMVQKLCAICDTSGEYAGNSSSADQEGASSAGELFGDDRIGKVHSSGEARSMAGCSTTQSDLSQSEVQVGAAFEFTDQERCLDDSHTVLQKELRFEEPLACQDVLMEVGRGDSAMMNDSNPLMKQQVVRTATKRSLTNCYSRITKVQHKTASPEAICSL